MADRRAIWAREAQGFIAFLARDRPTLDLRALTRAIPDLATRAPDARVPVAQVWALWQGAVDATGDRTLPVRYGFATQLDQLGLYGFAVMTAPTARDALTRAGRYIHLVTNSARLELVDHGDECCVRWHRDGARDRGHGLGNETVLAQIAAAMCHVVGKPALRGVAFRHAGPAEPRAAAQIARAFGCPVAWRARHDQLTIATSAIDRPTVGANPAMSQFFEAQARAVVAPASLADEVRAAITEALGNGEPDARAIAARLGMAERSLRRALAAERVAFRGLVNEVRSARARELLAEPRLTLTDIAFALGFSEHSAFTRAFTRWFGMSPARYRRA